MNNDKLQKAIDHLRHFYSVEDNYFYYSHSPESLKKALDEIQDSIDFLESLKLSKEL